MYLYLIIKTMCCPGYHTLLVPMNQRVLNKLLFGSFVPAICNRTSSVQAHDLPQSH